MQPDSTWQLHTYPDTKGEATVEFTDRLLKCSDCHTEFVFTAGEQLFFFDKQFKNDPKRCKLCKAKRAGASRAASTGAPAPLTALPLSRTETRTDCSACGVATTVPFKPTQGRPVLCRSCFQLKRVPSAVTAVVAMDSVSEQVAAATAALQAMGTTESVQAHTAAIIEQTPAEVVAESIEMSHGAELVAATLDA